MVARLNLKLWRDLVNLKAQTFTTSILVAVGVALLISSWSAYKSLQKSRDNYYDQFNFADIFAQVKRAPLNLVSQIEKIPGVRTVEPRLVFEGILDVPGQPEPAVGRFISIPDNTASLLNKVYLRSGRLPELTSEAEILIHESFALAHQLHPGDHLSATIQGKKLIFLIVGIALSPEYVYALSPSAPLPDDKHFGILWISRHHLQQISGMSSSFNDLSVSIYSEYSAEQIIDSINRILKPYGSYGAYSREKQTSAVFLNDEIKEQKISSVFSPTVFLSIAAFLIHVITTRLIALQRLQIATLKAIGYYNSEISFHYAKLILLMLSFGIIPGILLGAWLGNIYSNMYKDFFRFPSLNFSLNFESALVGIFAGVLPGLFGAYTAIHEAFRLVPAQAMRPLAPPVFHKSFFNQLTWISFFSVRFKMLWRNLFFRPWRLLLTVAGLSSSLSVIILSSFWSDTIDTLLNIQFQKIHKEDISLGLITPKPLRLLQELYNIPGITQVEAYRSVGVRITYLNFKKEITLFGYPAKTQLKQPLNKKFEPMEIPDSGLYLSRYFETEWGLRIGSQITVEILEGKPRTHPFKIAGFTDDFIGQSAMMALPDLSNMLDEPFSYNVVSLKSDSRYQNELYTRFKTSPNIGSVNFKTVMYRGFQESFGDLMKTSTNILIAFALAIAVSVIYNSVRVSFSERTWEMASLRVLGFSKSDVYLMLVGEILVQVLLSIIPGCLLGRYLSHLSLKMLNTEYFSFPSSINYKIYFQAVLVQYFSLILSLVIIWILLKKLDLVEALKARD